MPLSEDGSRTNGVGRQGGEGKRSQLRLPEAEQQKQEKDAYRLEHLLLSVLGKRCQKFVLPCTDKGKDIRHAQT